MVNHQLPSINFSARAREYSRDNFSNQNPIESYLDKLNVKFVESKQVLPNQRVMKPYLIG